MNISRFISQGLLKNKKGTFAFTVTRIATASIAIGLMVLIISYGVLKGFNTEIQNKIFTLSGHLQVIKNSTQYSLEDIPLTINTELYKNKSNLESVDEMYPIIRKPSIMKTDEGVQGVLLKGVDTSYLSTPFTGNLVEGEMLTFNDSSFSRDVVISRMLSNKMLINIGDNFLLYFIQNPPKFRKMKVSGIYETGMEELDERFVICDYKMIQGINRWGDTLVGGYEIIVKNFDELDAAQYEVFDAMDYDLSLSSVKNKYAQIFDWFQLLNNNVTMLMVIIFIIVCINVSTSFIIIILEKMKFIGTLKALGATNAQIRKIFFSNGFKMIFKGLIIGNIIGVGLSLFQYYTELIPLDAENYYVDHVPILFDLSKIVFVNVILLFVSIASLLLPTLIVSTISPIKSIRME